MVMVVGSVSHATTSSGARPGATRSSSIGLTGLTVPVRPLVPAIAIVVAIVGLALTARRHHYVVVQVNSAIATGKLGVLCVGIE